MTIAINTSSRKKLILAKLAFNQGVTYTAPTASTAQRLIAALAFDWAIETVLKAAVTQVDNTVKPSDLSSNLFKNCTDKLSAKGHTFSRRADAEQVRDIRNAAQHQARIPTNDELVECRIHARDFLASFTLEIWGDDFTAISVADLIQHTEVRGLLLEADHLINGGEYRFAAAHALAAVQMAIGKVERAIVGKEVDIPWRRTPSYSIGGDTRNAVEKINEELRGHANALQRIRSTVLLSALGLDMAVYLQLGTMIGEVLIMAPGNVRVMETERSKPVDRETALHMIAVFADMVAQIETKVGDLEKPFGYEYWF